MMLRTSLSVLSMGDFLRLRWDSHSEHEWEEVDIFKQLDGIHMAPPTTPEVEGRESSDGGPVEDPPLEDTLPFPDEDNDHPDPNTESTPARPEPATRVMPFSEDPRMRKRVCTEASRSMPGLEASGLPATINYGSTASPPASSAIYLAFQNRLLACGQNDPRTLEQIAYDEWSVPLGNLYFTLNGRVLAHQAACSCVPIGATVVARARLRGGTATPIQKLRGLLSAKGVPDSQLEARIKEIKDNVGERGIREAYESFDPMGQAQGSVPYPAGEGV